MYLGIVTTSTALYALIAQLATHQSVQTMAQEEISNVIGDRPVCLKDRANMPYVDAMLLELLRLISHVPLCLPHQTLKNTTLQGHRLPKGTTVSCNRSVGTHFQNQGDIVAF